jgi:ATP-binding cassette subfamily C exporter for protease/lipase
MKCPAFLERSDLGRGLWLFRREFVWVGIFSCVAQILLLSPTLYMMQVYDRVVVSQNELTLIGLTLVIAIFIGAMAFAGWIRSRLLVRAGVRFDEFLNSRVFRANFEANLNQSAHNPVRAFSDLTNLRQFLTGNAVFAIFDMPWTPIYIAVLFLMHPVLGWVSLLFLLILLLVAWIGHWISAEVYENAADLGVQSSTHLASKLRNAETVQAMGMLGNLRRQWLAVHERQLAGSEKAQLLARRMQALSKFIQYSQQSIILSVGAWLVIRGELSMGTMIASNALMSHALRPVGMLASGWKQFVQARQAFKRLDILLAENPERAAGHPSVEFKGQVTVQGLVANAPKRGAPILKDISVEFAAGECVAIVGPSGAGKSTFARCLLGIWPQTEGDVLLDGQSIRLWSREDLGPLVGYLPQDIELFDGTIAENISRFRKVDSDKVIAAAKRTGIHDMVLRLPNGYDTPMGLAGSLLSGGQRQRIALARALYGDPSLVVLDEPNANLDELGVFALTRALRDLKEQGTTIFLIVHQRALLSLADRVLVLQDGMVAQLSAAAATRTEP